MFDFDDPIPLLTALRQWTKDERKGLVALIRLCEWAVEGSFAPSGFHMMSGRRPDPLDALQAARAIAAGTSFTETWNHDPGTGLLPVATSPLDPVQYIDTLIISGTEADAFRQRHAPSGWFRLLFGLRSDHLPPRCPDFEAIEQRHQEDRRQQAEAAYTCWRATPEGVRVAGLPAPSADHLVPERRHRRTGPTGEAHHPGPGRIPAAGRGRRSRPLPGRAIASAGGVVPRNPPRKAGADRQDHREPPAAGLSPGDERPRRPPRNHPPKFPPKLS